MKIKMAETTTSSWGTYTFNYITTKAKGNTKRKQESRDLGPAKNRVNSQMQGREEIVRRHNYSSRMPQRFLPKLDTARLEHLLPHTANGTLIRI